jgi:hypothetical protein
VQHKPKMSNVVEFILGVKDFLSPALAVANKNIAQNTAAIAKSAGQSTMAVVNANKAVIDLSKAVAGLGNQYKILNKIPMGVAKGFPSAPLTAYGNNFKQMEGKILGVFTRIGNTATAGVNKVKGFGTGLVNMGKMGWNGITKVTGALLDNNKAMNFVKNGIGDLIGSTAVLDGIQSMVSMSTEIWTGVQEVLNVVMEANPIGIVIVAIVGLVLWVKHLCNHNKYWAQSMKDLWGVIKSFAHSQFTIWKMIGETIWYWIQFAWLKIKGFAEYTTEVFSRIGKSMKLALDGDFSGAKEVFSAEIKTKADVELAKVTADHNKAQAGYKVDLVKDAVDIVKGLKSTKDNIKTGWDKRKEAGTDPNPEVKEAKKTKDVVPKTPKAVHPKALHAGKGGSGGGADNTANAITSGGSKSIIINIHEVGNGMQVYVSGAKEAGVEVSDKIRQELIKIFGSAAHATF